MLVLMVKAVTMVGLAIGPHEHGGVENEINSKNFELCKMNV